MAPVYSYHHIDEVSAGSCPAGSEFDFEQPSMDLPLGRCPYCGKPVERSVGAASIRTRKFDCELKDMGFTKLVRVDEGIFENKTRRHGEDKYVDRRDPATFPNLKKTVKD
ncbi:transcriptional regulator [Deltaproteobacteria bacterium Smac51]|nr:transcriptional regulator [Deltaproteobacteria bacterium Smac51]